ncbi:uncharacterized protein LOC110272156 [Arachis ipaensis]|uniref:uncharacterized protein LOC110272156 n=1 Tax=Arachis ipaensis TaxID=130454 RepID=UPI000A2B879C|nr:uncharacterized protein LOC110272156 [Arachis ipaensis]
MGESDERKPGLGGRRHRRASSLPSLEIWSSPPIVLEPPSTAAVPAAVKPQLAPPKLLPPLSLRKLTGVAVGCRRSVWFCFELRSRVRGRRGQCCGCQEYQGHLVVLSCIEGSPAARAGIHQGDELVEINGERLDGLDSEAAAQRLRGNAGTTVTVKSTDQKALKKILVAAHDKSQKKVDKAIEDIQKDEGRDTK